MTRITQTGWRNRNHRATFNAVIVAALALSGSAIAQSFPGGQPITAADLTATPPALPAEPPAYNSGSNSPNHTEYARFAWRQFIYLNSPAEPSGKVSPGVSTVTRGVVNPKGNFVDSGAPDFYSSGQSDNSNFSTNILVWESFAHRTELLPKSSSKLPPFQTTAPQFAYQNITVSNTESRFNNLDENNQIGQNTIFFPKNPPTPSSNPFDDYQILFEAKVNQAEYDYVQTFFPAPSKDQAPTDLVLPPNTTDSSESIEIKAAWRVLTDDQYNSGRYHTAEAVYYTGTDEDPTPQTGVFGLVGLHIIRKMENYPTFTYATFQHMDNLKTPSGQDTGVYFLTSYDQLAYDAPTGSSPFAVINNGSTYPVTITLPKAGDVVKSNGYNFVPGTYQIPAGMAGPIAVVQPPTITDTVEAVNAEVKQAMASSGQFKNSVWQYYELKGIQAIPVNEQNANEPVDPATLDFYLANDVIESSQPGVQLFKGGVAGPTADSSTGKVIFTNNRAAANILNVPNTPTVTMGGCMGCHGNALNGDGDSLFNFLLINKNRLAGGGYANPDAIGAQSGDAVLERAVNYFSTGSEDD